MILQLNLSDAWGGMEMSTLKVARHFKSQGYGSAIVTTRNSSLQNEAVKAGVEVFPIPPGDHLAPSSSLALRQVIKKSQAEMVMVHQLRNLWILRPALWGLPRIRVVGFARMFLKDVRKKDLLHRHLYGRLEKMIALSEPQRDALLPCLPVPKDRYVVIPNGVDTERFNPKHRSQDLRRKEFGAQENDIVVGLIGRIDEQKGQRELIEAIGFLKDRFPHTRYVLVGDETKGEEGLLPQLKNRVVELGIQERVRFLGQRSDTPQLMASMDILTVPSYEEAFGNVTIEGMASALPVVATNSGGTPALINDGEWGRLVAPRDARSLATGIEEYLAAPGRALAHGRRAREEAERRYSLPAVMLQIEKIVRP